MNHMRSMFDQHSMFGLPAPDMGSRQVMPHRYNPQHQQMSPFGGLMYGGMFGNMDSMFNQMRARMEQIPNDPNSQCFSSSTVMSYSNTGDGPPQMYQASSQTRTAPGGIRETRRSERDSRTGVDKMAVGHHIHDRGHVVERARNREGGMEEKQDFINLDENEAQSFNEEWEHQTRRVHRGVENRGRHRHSPAALPDNRPGHRTDRQRRPDRHERQ